MTIQGPLAGNWVLIKYDYVFAYNNHVLNTLTLVSGCLQVTLFLFFRIPMVIWMDLQLQKGRPSMAFFYE